MSAVFLLYPKVFGPSKMLSSCLSQKVPVIPFFFPA
jgi:hypothetical protein